jgi:hypothetical protein
MTIIRGLDEAMAKLREIGEEGERIASREIVASALNVQRFARESLTETEAVDTGRLRNSVTVAESDSELDMASSQATGGPKGSAGGREAPTMVRKGMLNAKIGTNVGYAWQIEHTGPPHPRPYLFPSAERERPQLLRRLQAELKKLEDA